MENTKPFKTYNQQLKILRDRGLNVSTDGSPKRALERIGYYTLINGYKTLFLAKGSDGKVIHPEKYILGADFKEILSLYDFDKELRSILYEGLLEYETILGSKLSYYFSKNHQEPNAYLAINNFDSKNVSAVVKTISSLSRAIDNRVTQGKKSNNAIKHYVNNHGHVPLWVLVNFLTFGEISHFFNNCTEDIKRLNFKNKLATGLK